MYCTQFRPKPYEPQLGSNPTSQEFKQLVHRRFYGALLLRDLGCCGGNASLLSEVEKAYHVDHGDLQRFWETCEMYVQLVRSMCEALNWTVLVRLLGSLKEWFKSRIPRSFECFLQKEDKIPMACIQTLVKEELEVRDIAEMSVSALYEVLRSGCRSGLGVGDLEDGDVNGDEMRLKRRRDIEWYLSDMRRISEVLKKRACERRLYLEGNRELNKLLGKLEESEMSILLSPLASDHRKLLNQIENEESEGERSDGVLSVSEDSSEREEEVREKKKRVCVSEYGNEECILTYDALQHYSAMWSVCLNTQGQNDNYSLLSFSFSSIRLNNTFSMGLESTDMEESFESVGSFGFSSDPSSFFSDAFGFSFDPSDASDAFTFSSDPSDALGFSDSFTFSSAPFGRTGFTGSSFSVAFFFISVNSCSFFFLLFSRALISSIFLCVDRRLPKKSVR